MSAAQEQLLLEQEWLVQVGLPTGSQNVVTTAQPPAAPRSLAAEEVQTFT